jgi:hypothetical protein
MIDKFNEQNILDKLNNAKNKVDDLNNILINDNMNNNIDNDIQKLLYNIYVVEKNYDGINELYRKAKIQNPKIKKNDVKLFLLSQKSYQRTYQPIKEKKFLPIYSEKPSAYQMDLTFIPQYKNENKGIYVLFTAININTRYAYASYATNKDTNTILNLFNEFHNNVNEINYIMGDLGSEFTNKKFLQYLDSQNISYHFFKSDSHKLGIINRFHRTLKEKILKYMLANDTTVWYDVLQDIIKNYNNSYHRGIKMRPIDVNNYYEQQIITSKRNDTEFLHDKQPQFNINDIIRVKTIKNSFNNKMEPLYSAETYKLTKINKNTVNSIDINDNTHSFKKDNIIVVNSNEFINQNDMIKENKKSNTISRKIKNENLINEPVATRLRTRENKNKLIYNDNYIT